ncbi:MAG: aminotransferase class I/II-fold pyridoxal phosphate-dependent enzyme [Candidatus Micrarchaeia archaeon]
MTKPALSERSYKVKYEIRDIVARAKKVQASGKKIHWFNIGDPNLFGFKPPAHVTQAIKDALDNPKYTSYCPSQGDPDLVEAVAKREGVANDSVFVTSGLSEGIDFAFQALVDPGDNVLLPSPSYPLYTTKCEVLGGVPNYYKCQGDWSPDVEDMRKKVNERTKAIVVINPNNPTGANYSRKALQEIADIASEHKIPIIADEIYDQMTLDSPHSINMRDLKPDTVLISGNGISKNYLYPGARVGFLSVHNDGEGELKSALMRFCNARLSVNWEMQRGALAAVTGGHGHVAHTISELKKRREAVVKGIGEIEGLSVFAPQATFYSFVKVESENFGTDKDFAYSLLDNTGVLVVPGSSFSPVLGGKYFRLVFLAPPAELEEAFGKISGFLKTRG